jgi:hypothetical protein
VEQLRFCPYRAALERLVKAWTADYHCCGEAKHGRGHGGDCALADAAALIARPTAEHSVTA